MPPKKQVQHSHNDCANCCRLYAIFNNFNASVQECINRYSSTSTDSSNTPDYLSASDEDTATPTPQSYYSSMHALYDIPTLPIEVDSSTDSDSDEMPISMDISYMTPYGLKKRRIRKKRKRNNKKKGIKKHSDY